MRRCSFKERIRSLPPMSGTIMDFIDAFVRTSWTVQRRKRQTTDAPTMNKMRAVMATSPDLFRYERARKVWVKYE